MNDDKKQLSMFPDFDPVDEPNRNPPDQPDDYAGTVFDLLRDLSEAVHYLGELE